MIGKIFDFIKKYNMISPGDIIICGLSGGADSVSLLLSLYELREQLGITVNALHVNHCLRGAESDRDEEFCRKLCSELGVGFEAVSCDVASYAEKHSVSLEEAARRLRYAVFREHSQGKKLATAHNANDNLETVILNMTRGSALKGFTGIPPVRENIIRPMLTVSRREIDAFLAERGQEYVTDSTNLSDDYTRNKIRHRIIPLLEEMNSSIIETSIKSIDAMRAENDFIEEQTEKAMNVCRHGNIIRNADTLPQVIRRRCIARLLTENSIPYSYDRLEAADVLLSKKGRLNVAGDFFLVSDGKNLELKEIAPKKSTELLEAPLVIGENNIFGSRTMFCKLILCDDLKKNDAVHKKLTSYLLDYDKIIGRAVVRNRRFGDRIQLSGRNFNSSVKKLINENVPIELRSVLHFIEDEQGTIFAEHIGISGRVAPDTRTKRFLEITVRES